jgi:hypothetical protein
MEMEEEQPDTEFKTGGRAVRRTAVAPPPGEKLRETDIFTLAIEVEKFSFPIFIALFVIFTIVYVS